MVQMKRLAVWAVFAACAICARGATWYVDINNPKAGDDEVVGRGTEAKPYWSIQAAVERAAEYDTVYVKPGYYTNNTATCSAGDKTRQLNRVVLVRNVHLYSTEGKANTFIVGAWRKNCTTWTPGTESPVGEGAVRCLFIEPEAASSIVKGFTLTGGATDNSSLESDGGGGLSAPGGGYLVDSAVTNCAGYSSSAVNGGTLVRCYVEPGWPYPTSGYAIEGSRLWNSVVYNFYQDSSGAGEIVMKNTTAVNATIIGGYSTLRYVDCNLYNVLSVNVRYGDYQDTIEGGSVAKNCWLTSNQKAKGKRDWFYHHLTNPFIGDYRLLSTSDARGVGKGDWVNGIIELPDDIERKDYTGNDVSEVIGSVHPGCSQDVADPIAGGYQLGASQPGKINGLALPGGGYLFATNWPCLWEIETEGTQAGTTLFFERADLYNVSLAHAFLWPLMDRRFVVMPQPTSCGLVKLNEWKGAERIWVDASAGNDSTGNGSESKPYKSLQKAANVSAAYQGDGGKSIIEVKPGTYDLGGEKSSRLYFPWYGNSSCIVRSTAGAASTSIVGSGAMRCVYMGPTRCMVQGFTLRGGNSDDNAIAYAALVADCIVTNCASSGSGQALNGNAIRTRFTGNSSGGNLISPGSYTVSFCEFLHNTTGKPILNGTSKPKIYNCTFYGNNVTTGDGEAFYGSADIYPNNCILDGNGARLLCYGTADDHGPCLYNNCTVSGTLPARFFAEDPLFAEPAAGDVRIFRFSPAIGAGDLGVTASYMDGLSDYAVADISGEPIALLDDARTTLGARQSDLAAGARIAARANDLKLSDNISLGCNIVKTGESLTFTVQKGSGGTRNGYGLRVEDVTGVRTNAFDGVSQWTVNSVDTSVSIDIVYNPNWYVDAVNGNDSNTGFATNAAKKTLRAAVSVDIWDGDVVNLLPGTYNAGSMKPSNMTYTTARVVLPEGVTMQSTDGKDVTIIEGADDPSPIRDACGANAMRCVYMNDRSVLRDLTLRKGRTYHQASSGDDNRSQCGGGVYAAKYRDKSLDSAARIINCDFTDCQGLSGAGVYGGLCYRCTFRSCGMPTWTASNSVVAEGTLVSCLIDGLSGTSSVNVGPNCDVYSSSLRSRAGYAYVRESEDNTFRNCVLVGDNYANGNAYYGCMLATNVQWTASDEHSTFHDSTPCTSCVHTYFGALGLDSNLAPTASSGKTVDAGLDAYLFDQTYEDRYDVVGAPRIMNKKVDVGAYEYDIRPEIEDVLGGRISSVDWISRTVVSEGRSVTMSGNGAQLEATLSISAETKTLRIPFQMSDGGTLKAYVNGVLVQTVTAGETLALSDVATGDQLVLVYEGSGKVTLSSLSSGQGCVIMWRFSRG